MGGKVTLTGKVLTRAHKMLPQVAAMLENAGVRYCLDGGTLLGIYRDGGLLPWDNDMDLFVDARDVDKILALRWWLWRIGCRLSTRAFEQDNTFARTGQMRILKVKTLRHFGPHRGTLNLDVIVKYKQNDHYFWKIGKVIKKVPSHFYDSFGEIEFRGRVYPTPCDLEAYLATRYGDFRQVVKDYDYQSDDRSIVR